MHGVTRVGVAAEAASVALSAEVRARGMPVPTAESTAAAAANKRGATPLHFAVSAIAQAHLDQNLAPAAPVAAWEEDRGTASSAMMGARLTARGAAASRNAAQYLRDVRYRVRGAA